MDAHDCTACRSASCWTFVFLFGLAGAIGIAAVPAEWREPIGRSLLAMSTAAGALLIGVLLLILVEALWSRFLANPLRYSHGVCIYRGEVVYGWVDAGRELRLITRRRALGMQAHSVSVRLLARRRALNALRRARAPQVNVDCDAIGRGILRWGEQPELLPLLQRAGLLDGHRPVFGQAELIEPTDANAWRELCNQLWKQPHERPIALMLATRCKAETVHDPNRVACASSA